MSIILKRLERSFAVFLQPHQSKETIASYIHSLSSEARAELIAHHAQLNIEYNTLCSKIAISLEVNPNIFELREQMVDALKTAELLDIIYRDYLDSPIDTNRLQREQQAIRQWLYLEQSDAIVAVNKTYFEQWIRDNTNYFNFHRLFAVRFRKLILAITPFIYSDSIYNETIQPIDQYASLLLTNIACFYFLPRLVDNLAMIIKHTVEYDTMSEEEKALGWQTRLSIQLRARWVDLSNDIPWLIDNIISMFVLVGPLLPYKIVYSICMQLCDITQACTQRAIEIDSLYHQRDEYIKCRDDFDSETNEYHQLNSFIEHFDKLIEYENQRLLIPIINTSILLLALILATPILAPGCAVAGGIIAVLATFGSYLTKQHIEAQKPPNRLFDSLESTPSNTGFFSGRAPAPNNEVHSLEQTALR